jgi:hypothetical protein
MLYFSALGLLLSGYLSYNTLFVTTGCSQALITCGGTTPVQILGVSQCIYGFFMFLATAGVAVALLQGAKPKTWLPIQLWLGVASSLFGGGLSVYELWFRTPKPTTMPSCVYGFFLFFGVLLTAFLAKNAIRDSAPNPATATSN